MAARPSGPPGQANETLPASDRQIMEHIQVQGVRSRMVVKGSPFCRKAIFVGNSMGIAGWMAWIACTEIAACREVLPGRQDLPK